MRGRPWLRLFLVLLAFAALAVPVWRLTRPGPAATASTDTKLDQTQGVTAASESELLVSVDFVPPPRDFQLQYLGRTLLEGRGPKAGFSTPWRVALPKEGADLALSAAWPADGQPPPTAAAAARIRVAFPDGRVVDKTFWTQPQIAADNSAATPQTPPAPTLVEIFTVPGESPPMPIR